MIRINIVQNIHLLILLSLESNTSAVQPEYVVEIKLSLAGISDYYLTIIYV